MNIKLCGGSVTENEGGGRKILLTLKPERRDILIPAPETCQERWHWN